MVTEWRMAPRSIHTTADAIAYLRSPLAIRDRCHCLLDLAIQGELQHFDCNLDRLEPTVDFVLDTLTETYPQLNVPFHSRWRHFDVGGIPRLSVLNNVLLRSSKQERAKAKLDLAVVSVLLDAGAGQQWSYTDPASGMSLTRSEGLAVASLVMFGNGFFSSDPQNPMQVDGGGLQQLTASSLAAGFQATDTNPLVGLEGRLELLHRLGQVLEEQTSYFGSAPARPGNLLDYWISELYEGGEAGALPTISAVTLLRSVLDGLGPIWPGRIELEGVNLGDVWSCKALSGDEPGADLIPFHKLSQWMTYSLVEPLQGLGWRVTDLEHLTGLAEYRNGGLFVDMDVLIPKHAGVSGRSHLPGSEIVVQWRALTLALLDRLAERLRDRLGLTASEFPLARVLEGGTWSAGRKIARQKRADGSPPISIQSDGTVF